MKKKEAVNRKGNKHSRMKEKINRLFAAKTDAGMLKMC